MIVMHRPQKEYDVHVLISYIYKLSALLLLLLLLLLL